MIDFEENTRTAKQLTFHSDMSANASLSFGAIFNRKLLFSQWEPNFIKDKDPSIEYLELVGVVTAVLTWGHELKD